MNDKYLHDLLREYLKPLTAPKELDGKMGNILRSHHKHVWDYLPIGVLFEGDEAYLMDPPDESDYRMCNCCGMLQRIMLAEHENNMIEQCYVTIDDTDSEYYTVLEFMLKKRRKE